ncbi:MAG: methylenetetrahydrofolate reductase [NAD(P)H] [Ruminococcus sp.]|nr:methylenetetrahydrofolate reductase [NAD(P)H] [Ruminococcus sp.]
MKISKLFESKKPVFSLEIFPPKKNAGGIETIYETLDGLKDLKPDFISVTYGAGGNLADNSTCEICSIIKNKYNILPIAHLTCVNNSKSDIDVILENLKEAGVSNILALRGDINPDIPPKDDFAHADELVAYIKSKGDFDVSGACYPETHPDSEDAVSDILNLKHKVDCGAEHLMSQLFFNNEDFYSFREKACLAGINVPIEAGIMPITNKNQILRMATMCGASIPRKMSRILNRFEDNPKALEDAGIAYAIDQIIDLIANGVDGIHLYTMNKPYIAQRIFAAIESMR